MIRGAAPPRPPAGPHHRRGLLPWLLAAALQPLGLGLAAGLADASHFSDGLLCEQPWSCHWNLRPDEKRSKDTWIDEANPDRNYDTGENSDKLTVRAGPGQAARALIRFPIEDLPRNATLLDSTMYFAANTNPGRTLRVYEIRHSPFTEGTVTWNIAKATLDYSPDPVANKTIQNEGGPFNFGGYFTIPGESPLSGLSGSIRKYYLGLEPYYGHIIKDSDEANTLTGLPQSQVFKSSSPLNNQDSWPFMTVTYDPNAPEIRGLKVDGEVFTNASSTRPVNLSLTAFDRVGEISGAWINATFTADGHEVFNKSLTNSSVIFRSGLLYSFWSNESLNLPPGQYTINAFLLDNDGNRNFTAYRVANITVENTPPFANQSRLADGSLVPFVSKTELGEGEPYRAQLTASDSSGIASVKLELERGGEILSNESLSPFTVDRNGTGEWRLDTKARFAGFLNATLWVQDRAGNLNHTARILLHVRDVLAPVFAEAKVLTPAVTADGAVQEEGGLVAWQAKVADASPLTVTLELSTPTGQETIPMPRQGLTDVYRYARNFTDRGSYGARIVARDVDGNSAARDQLGFFMLQAEAPVLSEFSPPDLGFGAGRPSISALVSDLNLDPASFTMRVGVPPDQAGTRVEATLASVTETSRRITFDDRFFDGDHVEVTVRASDFLGRTSERTWSFTVDDHAPLTFLGLEGPSVAGARTAITGNTSLRFDRSDDRSGLLATVLAIVHEDRNLGTGNITITGAGPALFNLSASPVYAGSGNYTVTYSSVDRAGNVEPPQQRRFLVDDSPPQVRATFEPGRLTARVDERGTGVRDVRASYWISPSGLQGTVTMSPNADKTVWQARIPDAERGATVLYAVEATDQIGNVGRAGSAASPLQSIVQNHRPEITIAPGNGTLARGAVTISWSASDRDGDRLQTSVAVRPSTATLSRELAPQRGDQGSITWDTRTVGDGLWAIEVTAKDGFDTVVETSFVDVANGDTKLLDVKVNGPEPETPVRVETTIYKPVLRAEAVLLRGSQEVARFPLNDNGSSPDRVAHDGVFTGEVVVPQGDYRLDLEVLFTDGRLEHRESAAGVRVQYAFPANVVHDPLLLAAIILVPAAVVGFFLYRRYGPIRTRR